MLGKRIYLLILALTVFTATGQEIAIGQWRAHLPYKKCIALAQADSRIYCATPYSLFYYDITDNSLNYLNKVNALSDVEISTIEFNETSNALVIAYKNANIDILKDDYVTNISDIKRKPIFGNKTINNILVIDNYAYLACGFGIVVIDLIRLEVKDTYYIGPGGTVINVYDLTTDGSNIYAATEDGIFNADLSNPNLANYASWNKDTTLKSGNASYNVITYFGGKIYTNRVVSGYGLDTMLVHDGSSWDYFNLSFIDDIHTMNVSRDHLFIASNYNMLIYDLSGNISEMVWTYNPGTPEPNAGIMDEEGNVWIADRRYSLVKHNLWESEFIQPNGPGTVNVFNIHITHDEVWVSPGGQGSSWSNIWNVDGVFSLIGDTWYTLKDYNAGFDTLFDIICSAVNPSDHNHVFAGSWNSGVVEIIDGVLVNVYNTENSNLEYPNTFNEWLGIGGMAFDKDNNLWVVNTGCNYLFKVRKADGTWDKFNVSSAMNQPSGLNLMIDSENRKWVNLAHLEGLLVFTDNNTISDKTDDEVKLLGGGMGNGALPSNNVLCLAEDLDGEIWIGSDKGVAVIYNPSNIFNGGNFDAEVINVVQDSTVQHLLEFESVTTIAVDGANRKWIGTDKAGVFLMSDDGQEEIYHFTEDNSPLLSNTITSIAIDNNSGEVFFGTAKGVISYRGTATGGNEVFESVYAFPNPVREGYTGSIGIKGLTSNAKVKITDVSGNLIYETIAEGGQAIWNGCNFSGQKAQSGVYLVFCSSEDGQEKFATKILIIN